MTKNDIIMHYNKFSNLGICHANFPKLKGPGTASQNYKKNLLNLSCLPMWSV